MNYAFTGWDVAPLELFDRRCWADCLHAVIQAFNVRGDPAATQAAMEDTGVIHELAHLACGIDINTHATLADLRQQLEWTATLEPKP